MDDKQAHLDKAELHNVVSASTAENLQRVEQNSVKLFLNIAADSSRSLQVQPCNAVDTSDHVTLDGGKMTG
jgi:hypothetical protein